MIVWVKGGPCYQEEMYSVFDMDGLVHRFGVPSFWPMVVVGGGGGWWTWKYAIVRLSSTSSMSPWVWVGGRVITLPLWNFALSVSGTEKPPPVSMNHSTQCVSVRSVKIFVILSLYMMSVLSCTCMFFEYSLSYFMCGLETTWDPRKNSVSALNAPPPPG